MNTTFNCSDMVPATAEQNKAIEALRQQNYDDLQRASEVQNNNVDVKDAEKALDKLSIEFVEKNRSKPIFRIFTMDHFLEIIGCDGRKGAKNTLVRVTTWEDVNEGFLYKMKNRLDNGQEVESYEAFLKKTCGQCWSMNNEKSTCYMWFGYKPDKKPHLVQVETTIGQLWDSIKYARLPNKEKHFFYLRNVEYDQISTLRGKLACTIEQQANGGSEQWQEFCISSLFFKNNPFEYESEIRLLHEIVDGTPGKFEDENAGVFTYGINPSKLVNKVIASPFMSERDYCCLECKMRNSQLGDSLMLARSRLFL